MPKVVLAVKAPSLEQVLPALAQMCSAQTIVIPALNGLPWWYLLGPTGPLSGHRLQAVDPDGVIERAIENGALGPLRKPFEVDELIKKIDEATVAA